MKLISNIVRLITGLLFIFSGFIKLNDPIGFKIKLEEYFNVFAADLTPAQDTLAININSVDMSVNENFRRILNNENVKKINIYTSDWEHVEVKDDAGKIQSQFDKTTIFVTIDGQELYKTDIQKDDVAPVKFDIEAKVAGKEIYKKNVLIYNNVKLNSEESIDVSKFKKVSNWLSKLCLAIIPFALILAIFICVFEIVLGVTLLIGWKRNLTLTLLALMIIFFTFLTWYSATYNKVTDCGCFGNAIPLTPWQSFIKDIVLCVFIFILVLLRKYIKPLFSQGFSYGFTSVVMVLSVVFAVYCWYFLPVFNFLKFKEGNDIEKLTTLPPGAKQEKREMMFIYTKDGKDFEFSMKELTEKKILENTQYKFKERIDKVIQEGDKPEIHDFTIADAEGQDHLNEFFEKNEYKLLMVSQGLTDARKRAMKKLSALSIDWTEKSKLQFWALTSSSPAEAEAIRHEYQFQFKFYFGDNTNLKSIIRSNPGLLLFKKGVVIKTWPSTNLPTYKEVLKYTK
ncbi:MAG: hypothetical protein IT243_07790 [Bacteroidia bacterium]|nr:hypothetical protein [Bacteroidia bacterium]